MKSKMLAAAALLTAGLSAFPASAALIYEQGALSTGDRGAYQYVNQQLADDFVALTTAQLTSATWTGSYYGTPHSGGTESFTFNIFAGGGATPGALLYSIVGNATVSAASTATYYNYSLTFLNSVTLNSGTGYWVDIYSNDSPSNYAWANSSAGTTAGALKSNNGSWSQMNSSSRSNHVFALQGGPANVPEPATAALLGLGLLGFAASRRKSAKCKNI